MLLAQLSTPPTQETVHFDLQCSALESESAAAFEARIRAELAVRGLTGSVRLLCAERVELEWHPSRAPRTRAVVPRGELTVERLLETFADLVESSTPPESQPAGETPVRDPDEARAPEESEPQPPDEPPPEKSPERPEVAPPSDEATPTTPAPVPSAEPNGSPQRHPNATVFAGGALGSWSGNPSLGLQLGAAIQVAGPLSIELEAAAAQAIPSPNEYEVRVFQGLLGARWTAWRGLWIGADVLLGGAQIQAPSGWELTAESATADDCALDGKGGICALLGARALGAWSFGRGRWRPELGIALEWSRAVRGLAEAPDGSTRVLSLPALRPSVILRFAWCDLAPGVAP